MNEREQNVIGSITKILYDKNTSLEFLYNCKKLFHNINNEITTQITKKSIQYLYKERIIECNEKDVLLEYNSQIHANSNGYDIQNDSKHKFIAEVKCNIPIKGNFGASQINHIKKDLIGLLIGKTKSTLKTTKDYYKFMFIQDIDNSKECMRKIINKCENVVEYTNIGNLNKTDVFVIFI